MPTYYSIGIIHKPCVDTPPQNSRVGRKHIHLLNVTRSRFHSKLPKCFWSYALTHVTFLKIVGFLSFAPTLVQQRDK